MSSDTRTYRVIPTDHGVCTVCDTTVEFKTSAARVGEPTPIKVHGPRGDRCPGGLLPAKPWIEASNLPTWDELSDLDKGAALMFTWKCHWERSYAYARDNYPARYFDHPMLLGLDRRTACRHAKAVTGRHGDVVRRLGNEEHDRLYNLALVGDRNPAVSDGD